MPDAVGRPQDQGRRHRRAGAPSAATSSLLDEYHAAMRDELRAVLAELRPTQDPQLQLDGSQAAPSRPSVEKRARLWDLAIKLGRELGSEVDAAPAPVVVGSARRRAGRVDYG